MDFRDLYDGALELRSLMTKDTQTLVLGASLISIFLSIYLFITGKRETGIFIGLWAPTILGLGSFLSAAENIEPNSSSIA